MVKCASSCAHQGANLVSIKIASLRYTRLTIEFSMKRAVYNQGVGETYWGCGEMGSRD